MHPLPASYPQAILSVAGLTLARGETTILDGLDWVVHPGQHWVILGANGSGKTSLLRALTGYLMPSSGEISLLDGKYGETEWHTLRRRIGMVSSTIGQMIEEAEPVLHVVLSGRSAMINYWGRIRKTEMAEAWSVLERVEGTHLARRPWGVLSQGERQRILIARALMADPRLLILDEPCAGLDPAARESFLGFLETIARSEGGPPLLFVTHHVEEILPEFTHVLLLKGGRILACGPQKKVLTSRLLSEAFGATLRLVRRNWRYSLSFTSGSRAGFRPEPA